MLNPQTIFQFDLLDTVLNSLNRPKVLWSVFLIVMALYVAISAILHYHWYVYGVYSPRLRRMEILYFVVSLGLIAALAVLIYFYLHVST